MKTVTNGYKNQIKLLGKEIDNVIRYYNHYQIITENNKYILTALEIFRFIFILCLIVFILIQYLVFDAGVS